MAAVIKVFKTLRNHWKKSTFGAIVGSYGVYYLNNKHNENLIRREYCKLALEYGQQTTRPTEKAKKVTVFLNPAAKNGKASKQFESNAAPILHLAGLNVEIFKSNHEGHVKDQVAALGATDAILVVGGDGTLAEVITGLLRRSDEVSCSDWPIGVIPVGVTNTLARLLYTDSTNEVMWMCNAALALVKGVTAPIDVMAIKDAEERTTFAVNHLRWSSLDDAKEKTTKYWYFGPLKHRAAFIFHTLSQSWPNNVSLNALYTGPKDIPVPPPPPVIPSIWTRMYWRVFGRPAEKPKEEEPLDVVVSKSERETKTTELVIRTNQLQEKDGKKFLSFMSGPEEVPRGDFISEGWRRLHSHDMESTKLNYHQEMVGDVDIHPDLLSKDKTEWYTIDSERFEAGPVSITLLPNKLNFFYQTRSSQPESSNSEAQR